MLVKSRTNDNNGLEPILPKEHEFICNQTVNKPKRDYTIVQQGHVFPIVFTLVTCLWQGENITSTPSIENKSEYNFQLTPCNMEYIQPHHIE